MAQHDYDINSLDAISGLQFRQDVNNVLSAIKSSNSGATAPTTYIAGTLWLDTSTTPHILKKRNTANTGWDTIRIEDALGAPIASATTTTVGTYSGGNTVHITGVTTITSLGVSTTGTTRTLIFDSALTITHNATSLICPNGLSITTVSGDAITVICEDGALGYWRVSSISRLLPDELSLIINSATAKITPADADLFGIVDSAASNVLKKLSWANIKTTLGLLFAPLASPSFTGTPTINGGRALDDDTVAYNNGTTSFISNTLVSGAIIEIGSNANGYYVQFADGTMFTSTVISEQSITMTTASGSMFVGNSTVGATFPSVFSTSANLSVLAMVSDGAGTAIGVSLYKTGAISTTSCGALYFMSTASKTETMTYTITAIGKWK